jgi:ERCC4-related helicase
LILRPAVLPLLGHAGGKAGFAEILEISAFHTSTEGTQQTSSSVLALERTLRRLRTTLVHTHPHLLQTQNDESAADEHGDWSDTDADLGSIPHGRSVWRNKTGVLADINDLLEQLGSVTSDQKREALEVLVEQLGRDNPLRVCVFCSSRVTASYLEIALSERGANVWRLTGENSPEQTKLWLEGFRQNGGVLIATIFALQGFDLREAEAFIHYDPPASDAEMQIRATRNPSATHYLLKDESGVLPGEWDATAS